jgi:hypothetical protein
MRTIYIRCETVDQLFFAYKIKLRHLTSITLEQWQQFKYLKAMDLKRGATKLHRIHYEQYTID